MLAAKKLSICRPNQVFACKRGFAGAIEASAPSGNGSEIGYYAANLRVPYSIIDATRGLNFVQLPLAAASPEKFGVGECDNETVTEDDLLA